LAQVFGSISSSRFSFTSIRFAHLMTSSVCAQLTGQVATLPEQVPSLKTEDSEHASTTASTDNIDTRRHDLSHEIEVRTNWAGLLESPQSPLVVEQLGDHEIWLVKGLFSEQECKALLAEAEAHGFGTTHYPKAYRGNLRLTTTDCGFADAVWQRLKTVVPNQMKFLQADEHEWEACGLNECWRLAKYHPGDRFKGHCDANFSRKDNVEESMLTVNIYMNEGFEGGSTRFYLDDDKHGHAKPKPTFSVKPETGLCLLFRQPPGQGYYHDGEELQSGLKYLFRSDVMYRNPQATRSN